MNIDYVYNTDFHLKNEKKVSKWLNKAVVSEGFSIGDLVYAFFNDNDLKDLNNRHLGHDYYTDVISFNDSEGTVLSGNIAISVDRVLDNSKKFKVHLKDIIISHNALVKTMNSMVNKTDEVETINLGI